MVNDAWHECLKPEDAAKLVDDLRARGEAALSRLPSRGRKERLIATDTKARRHECRASLQAVSS